MWQDQTRFFVVRRWLGMMLDERGEEIGAFIPRHVTICHIETSGKQFPALVLRSREITFPD